MSVYGIDVSDRQETIDWPRVVAAGITFALAKATEGVSFTARTYSTNARNMRRAGIDVPGAYHYLRGSSAGRRQAEHFIATVGLQPMLRALDVEASDVAPHDVTDFVTRYRELCDHPLIVYTGRDFWSKHGTGSGGSGIGPLWAAGDLPNRYVPGTGYLSVLAKGIRGDSGLPWGGWNKYLILQFTDKGVVPGIRGNVDGNLALSLNSIRAAAGIPVVNVPTRKGPDMKAFVLTAPGCEHAWLWTESGLRQLLNPLDESLALNAGATQRTVSLEELQSLGGN